MKTIYIFCFMLSSLLAGAQVDKVPLHEVKFSHKIEQEIVEGKMRTTSAAYFYTYISKYKEALNKYELNTDLTFGLDSMSASERAAFQNFKPYNAIDYILKRTPKEQVVIISEAHQKPQHRVFTKRLLKAMYKKGFRYLGIETLTPNPNNKENRLADSAFHERGYPLNSPMTGFYTREPQMSMMIREALDLGFKLFAYERSDRNTERDFAQAQNIKRFMDAHPDGKVIIHCGWFHAIESNFPKRAKDNWMAYHLKQMGVDPYTIYQDALSEKLLLENTPYYKMIQAEDVSVLLDKEGEVFNGADTLDHFDVMVYHPPTRYIKNRPHWLVELEGNQLVAVDHSKIQSYPVIVKAFRESEKKTATPMDIIEVLSAEDETALVLPNGEYEIVIMDVDRKEKSYLLNKS